MIKLYSYFRSSAAYRVRIALNHKGMDYEIIPVNLLKGEEKDDVFLKLNPQGLVPTLDYNGTILAQSMAIAEFLDDVQPEPKLVFGAPEDKSFIRQLSQIVACETHPLNNLQVLQYLVSNLGASDAQKMEWYGHWGHKGLGAFETLLAARGVEGPYCAGAQVSLADICLIPQLYNMRRFKFDLERYPLISKIEKNCMSLPAFQQAAPESQPDAPEDIEPIHGPNAPILKAA